jgi:hypothetical protein
VSSTSGSAECAAHRQAGVMKGDMTRTVAPDGTITYIFTERSPCDEASQGRAADSLRAGPRN